MKVPVLYTMGKVASRAVSDALVASGRRFHDIHTLDTGLLTSLARDRLDHGMLIDKHVCGSIGWGSEIRDPGRCFYISLVRDPIERNLAAVFQNLPLHTGAAKAREMIDGYPHTLPCGWFDNEFRKFLGIDVFEAPFDRVNGYALTDRFLIMRTDIPDARKAELLGLAISGAFAVGRANVGAAKRMGGLYESMRSATRFPAALVDEIYSSKFARHFWTLDERDVFRARWSSDGMPAAEMLKAAS